VAEQAAENLQRKFPAWSSPARMTAISPTNGPSWSRSRPPGRICCWCAWGPPGRSSVCRPMRKLPVGLMAGLGGSLDVFAGIVQRRRRPFRSWGWSGSTACCGKPTGSAA
jgi:hypothetical protein